MPSRSISDLDLLRAVYKRLDRRALLADHPELTAADLDAFFEKAAERLASAAKASVSGASSRAARPGATDVVLYTDGGSRGNPGPAGFGAVLLDAAGNTVDTLSGFIGRATNNEAEYRALIEGLRGALRHGARSVTIRADSQLVVRQITGVYKVRTPHLRPLRDEALALLGKFDSWRAEHVGREQNTLADALANDAMNRGA